MRFLIIIICLFLTACDHSRARTDLAARKYFKGQFRAAYEETRRAARTGNAQAQYALGYMYYYGKGVIADDKKAKYWFTAAALQGHPDAKRALKIIS